MKEEFKTYVLHLAFLKFHLTITPDIDDRLWIKSLNFYTSSHKTGIQNFQYLTAFLKNLIHWHWLKTVWKKTWMKSVEV